MGHLAIGATMESTSDAHTLMPVSPSIMQTTKGNKVGVTAEEEHEDTHQQGTNGGHKRSSKELQRQKIPRYVQTDNYTPDLVQIS